MNILTKKALKGISYLVIARVFSRIIDFILNILVIRELDPKIFGIINKYIFFNKRIKFFKKGLTIHYGLLINLVLFYVKNCLKYSYQKRTISA